MRPAAARSARRRRVGLTDPLGTRVAYRHGFEPSWRIVNVGFRVARFAGSARGLHRAGADADCRDRR